MSGESSELIAKVNLAAKRFVEAKAAAKKHQEDVEEVRGFDDTPSSSSSLPSSRADFNYSVMNADDVLKSMVARKVEMQNTAMDLDTSRKFQDMQNEVSKLSEDFDRNKPTAGIENIDFLICSAFFSYISYVDRQKQDSFAARGKKTRTRGHGFKVGCANERVRGTDESNKT